MAGFLKFLGVLLILSGIIGGVVIFGSANSKQYQDARLIYQHLPDNALALAEYQAAGLAYWPVVGMAASTAASGVVGGAILLGLGEGLSLLGAMALQLGAGKPEARRSFSTASWPATPED